jgi:hypothetical protein
MPNLFDKKIKLGFLNKILRSMTIIKIKYKYQWNDESGGQTTQTQAVAITKNR